VVALDAVESAGDAVLNPGDGAAHVRATFRLVLFRPSVNEVLEGRVLASDATGILVSLSFFNNIFVPASAMDERCTFNVERGRFGMRQNDAVEFIEPGDTVRVKVTQLQFRDSIGPRAEDDAKEAKFVPTAEALSSEQDFRVVASMAMAGLGKVEWWEDRAAEESALAEAEAEARAEAADTGVAEVGSQRGPQTRGPGAAKAAEARAGSRLAAVAPAAGVATAAAAAAAAASSSQGADADDESVPEQDGELVMDDNDGNGDDGDDGNGGGGED
jgi:DNA-directed RNA polymerase III subunit RPC8